MNIDDFRAMKAQEAEASQAVDQTPKAEVIETKTTPIVKTEETKPEVKPEETKTVTIEGIGEITMDELKNGYLRTSDYTQKTQALAKERKEVEESIRLAELIKSNPQLSEQLVIDKKIPKDFDPTQKRIKELEDRLFDIMLQQEISALESKYSDFEIRDVIEMAQKKQTTNLEDAYLLLKSTQPVTKNEVDVEALKKKIREDVIKELQADKDSTRTIITTGGATTTVQDNEPQLTEAEKKVARGMDMTEADYIKWKMKK